MRLFIDIELYLYRAVVGRFLMLIFCLCLVGEFRSALAGNPDSLLQKRRQFLNQLLQLLPADPANVSPPTPLDATWREWLQRTGELPPDFDQLPSLPFLPDPMILHEGNNEVPVTSLAQWEQKRSWIQE